VGRLPGFDMATIIRDRSMSSDPAAWINRRSYFAATAFAIVVQGRRDHHLHSAYNHQKEVKDSQVTSSEHSDKCTSALWGRHRFLRNLPQLFLPNLRLLLLL
jgi:hypothetical protein